MVNVDSASRGQIPSRRIVRDRDRLTGHGRIRAGRNNRATASPSTAATIGLAAVVINPNVLNLRFGDVPFRVGRLDVVVEQLAAETRQIRVVDFREVIVGHRIRLNRQEVIDLAVGGGRIQGFASLG